MGVASSLLTDLPERLDMDEIEALIKQYKLGIQIDKVRFDLLKDQKGRVSRQDALQLIENKLPQIYSINGALTTKR